MPLAMRIPKLRGNTSKDAMPVGPFRTYTQPVNIRDLERFEAGEEVTPETLKAKGLIRSIRKDVKLLGDGELTKKLTITVHGASATAREKIEAAGGTLTLLKEPKVQKAKQHAPAAARPRPTDVDEPSRAPRRRRPTRPTPTSPRARSRPCSPGSPTPGASRSSAAGCSSRRSSSRSTGSARGCRRRASTRRRSRTTSAARAARPRPAEPVQRLGALALLALRARDHAVRHGLDHPAAPDGRRSRRSSSCRRKARPGYAKINQYTRYLTVVLAAAQAPGYAYLFKRQGALHARHRPPRADRDHAHRRHDAADVDGRADHQARHRQRHLAADLRLDPHLGPGRDQRLDQRRRRSRSSSSRSSRSAIVVAVVFMQEGQRRIPIQYAKRMVGRRQTAGGSTYMPLRVNMAGVIPVIFAAAIMALPADDRPVLPADAELHQRALLAVELGLPAARGAADRHLHLLLHGGPVQPGRPGRQPAQVRRLHPGHPAGPADRAVPRPRADAADAARLALPGDRSRCCPSIFIRYGGFSQATSRALGGTSVLIVVGVALDTMRQMESQMMMRSYEGFLQ